MVVLVPHLIWTGGTSWPGITGSATQFQATAGGDPLTLLTGGLSLQQVLVTHKVLIQ